MEFMAFVPQTKFVWSLRLDELGINFFKLIDFTITVP